MYYECIAYPCAVELLDDGLHFRVEAVEQLSLVQVERREMLPKRRDNRSSLLRHNTMQVAQLSLPVPGDYLQTAHA